MAEVVLMMVLAEKRKKLSQTIVSLIGSLRTEKGYRRCDFCYSVEDKNELCVFEEWYAYENLNNHLKLEGLNVLRGVMTLLLESYELVFFAAAAGKDRADAWYQLSVKKRLNRRNTK